ncbi:Chain A, Crystal Structure Of A Designed Full Consensus Ankyrin [Ectocarpus siliculosus]|uniref:Chain A, Crystal Structure Of A Designed Full Consensus Ankyrin n=1 Tax=Ectocarpus siliculosus TaxID=2880 RepID=D7FJC8_ECTSI|nr:Chain A, Crystal Structure Of A Designed Full Consensus Ankyrin [Ectocarpus siliculosus]|eukprot:CBJ29031.1 Chain A, Crystal Structure Of A Designed Full Consensus Ankyrin [Ectocarpus siliculosus]
MLYNNQLVQKCFGITDIPGTIVCILECTLPPVDRRGCTSTPKAKFIWCRASQLGQIDVIQELIAADAIELNAQDGNGWTPLMHACARGHRSVVGALLTAGASVDIESHDGRTALHRAATWKRLGPLDQLIEAGADVRHGARNKWTPLHCAAAAGDAHACSILVGAGADVDAQV